MILTLEIDQRSKDSKTLFKYLSELSYVKIIDEKNPAFYTKFKKSVEEAKTLSSGKAKGKSLKALLDEL